MTTKSCHTLVECFALNRNSEPLVPHSYSCGSLLQPNTTMQILCSHPIWLSHPTFTGQFSNEMDVRCITGVSSDVMLSHPTLPGHSFNEATEISHARHLKTEAMVRPFSVGNTSFFVISISPVLLRSSSIGYPSSSLTLSISVIPESSTPKIFPSISLG